MTRKRVSTADKKLGEKLMDWGNIVFAGTVLTQLLSEKQTNLVVGLVGVLLSLGGYILGYVIISKGIRK